MRGHENGRYVADCTVAALCKISPAGRLENTNERARDALVATNSEVYSHARSKRRTMGATLVAAIFDQGKVGILWAGDSRSYLFRDGNLYSFNKDHRAVQELIDGGAISPLEAVSHPMRHDVTCALGVIPTLAVDTGTYALALDVIVLLSTDGLHGAISEEKIAAWIAANGLLAADILIALALAADGKDNITLILFRV